MRDDAAVQPSASPARRSLAGEGRTRGARDGVSSTRSAASARSKHPKGFVISQPPRVSRRRGVKLCVEYATRPDASAAGAAVRGRRPRRIGVGARVEFAARLAAPPPRPGRDEAARRTRAEFVSTNHRIVKEAAGRRFPGGPALAPGQGAKPSADGPAPRPGGEGGTRDADPPRFAGAGGFVSDRSRRHARGGRRPGGGSVARGKEDLNRGRSRLQEESRFDEKKDLRLDAGLSGPTRGDGVRASPRVSRRRRRAVDGRRRRPGGNPRDPAFPAWFSKYP